MFYELIAGQVFLFFDSHMFDTCCMCARWVNTEKKNNKKKKKCHPHRPMKPHEEF